MPARHIAAAIGERQASSFATLYLALSVDVAAAELRRLAARAGREVDDFMPRHLLEFDVKLNAILDLTDAEAAMAVGLDEAQLRADDATSVPGSRRGRAPSWAGGNPGALGHRNGNRPRGVR